MLFVQWLLATWEIISASAPWLLFGFLFAGIIHILLPTSVVQRFLQKPGFRSVFSASALGIPLPLCSCGVIPVGVSLRRAGASRGSTASFLVSTPEIGIDSFLLSYVLLGPLIAISRVFAAFVSALSIGFAIDRINEKEEDTSGTGVETKPASCCHKEVKAKSCCHEETSESTKKESKGSCCSSQASTGNQLAQPKFSERIVEALRYGFTDIVDDLAKVLAIGFLLAGLVSALLPDSLFTNIGLNQGEAMLLMLLVSLPLYVCAVASTPLAAALLVKGLNPGAVLVFLLAGPATNITTMLVVKKELGKRASIIYLSGIVIISLIMGFLLNYFAGSYSDFSFSLLSEHHTEQSPFAVLCGFLLTGLICWSLLKKNLRQKELNG